MIRLQTGRRLHFGLFAPVPLPDVGLTHGGLGAMVDAPGVILHAQRQTKWIITGQDMDRVRGYVALLQKALPGLSPLELAVEYIAPVHQGWGTGTQLALAVAKACYDAANLEWSSLEAAAILGRGKRSCIGTAGFDRGGLLVDEGRSTSALNQQSLPEAWTWILVEPGSEQGLYSEAERRAFKQLTAIDMSVVQELQQLAVQIADSARNNYFSNFAVKLTQYNRRAGAHYHAVQRGDYSSPLTEQRLSIMAKHGAVGRGQSSWGPGLFAVFENAADAHRFAANCTLTGCSLHVAATQVNRPINT